MHLIVSSHSLNHPDKRKGDIQATIKAVHPILSFTSKFGELDNRSWTMPRFVVVEAQWSGVLPSWMLATIGTYNASLRRLLSL
jgi:hypothetical protein